MSATYRHPVRSTWQDLGVEALASDEAAIHRGNELIGAADCLEVVDVLFGELCAHGEALF